MTPDLFHRQKPRGDRSHGQAISCLRCVNSDYTEGGIMIIRNYTNSIDGAISQRSIGGTTERRYINKILRNTKLLHDGCHGSK